jgi:hypothetical protein
MIIFLFLSLVNQKFWLATFFSKNYQCIAAITKKFDVIFFAGFSEISMDITSDLSKLLAHFCLKKLSEKQTVAHR